MQLLSETFLILGEIQVDMIINAYRSLCTIFSCHILIKLKNSRQISDKSSKMTFHENPSSGSRVVPCGRTDGRIDMTKLIVSFRNFSNAPKKTCLLTAIM